MKKNIEAIGIGSPFLDYFFDAPLSFLKKYKLKPEDDVLFKDKNITLSEVLSELPLLSKSIGGISLNTVSILTHLGLKTAYAGTIGNDKNGKFFLKNMKVSDKSMITAKGETPVCACVLNTNRKNRLFISTINRSDNDYLNSMQVEKLNQAKLIHISPFFKNPKLMVKKWGEILEVLDKPMISFTPSIVWTSLGLSFIEPVLKHTTILFLNEDEAKDLTRLDPKKGSKKLLQFGPKIVVVTHGAKGVLITSQKEQFFEKSKPVKKIVDTTGAGDAFAAGFLYGVLKNKSLKWSALFGNKMGARALSDFGLNWLD